MVLFLEGKKCEGGGAKEELCVYACVCRWVVRGGVGGVGVRGATQPRLSPVSMCQAISLFLHVTDTHVGSYQPKLLQLMAVPLRCPMCSVLARVTRYGLGSVSPVT